MVRRTVLATLLLSLAAAAPASASRMAALNPDGTVRLAVTGSDFAVYYTSVAGTPVGTFKSYGNPPGFNLPPALAKAGDGSPVLFGISGGNGNLYANHGSQWVVIARPLWRGTHDAIAGSDGRIRVVGRTYQGALTQVEQTATGWSAPTPWTAFGGTVLSDPFLMADPSGAFGLLARDADSHARYAVDGGASRSLGGELGGRPTGVRDADGDLRVFARGSDGALWGTEEDLDGPEQWVRLGDAQVQGAPSAALDADDRVHVFVRAADGRLLHTVEQSDGTWSAYTALSPAGVWQYSNAPMSSLAEYGMLDAAVVPDGDGTLNVFFANPDWTWDRVQQSGTGFGARERVGRATPQSVPPVTTLAPSDHQPQWPWPPVQGPDPVPVPEPTPAPTPEPELPEVVPTPVPGGPGPSSRTVTQGADGTFRLAVTGSNHAAYLAVFSGTPSGTFTSFGNPPGFINPITVATAGDGTTVLFGNNPGSGQLHANHGSGWSPIGRPVWDGSIDAITDAYGRIHVVGRTWAGDLTKVRQRNDRWTAPTAWTEFGGKALSDPFLMREPDAAFGLLARDADSHARYAVDGGASRSLGGSLAGRPTGLRDAGGDLRVFARGADGALWGTEEDPNGPEQWERLGDAQILGAPAAALDADGRVHVFARAADGRVLATRQQPDGTWSAYHELTSAGVFAWQGANAAMLGERGMTDPAVVLDQAGRLNVFFSRPDFAWYRVQQSGTGWGERELIGRATSTSVPPITTDPPIGHYPIPWPPADWPDPEPTPEAGTPTTTVTPGPTPIADRSPQRLAEQTSIAFSVQGKASKRATNLRSLRVRGLPARAVVKATCAKGCARTTLTVRASKRGDASLDRLAARRPLRPGTKIRVKVTAPGWTTATHTLTVRAGRSPLVATR